MRVAVVGGTGYVGGPVVRALSRDGHDVEPIGRRESDAILGGQRPPAADAIVNLAHPRRGPSYAWPDGNRRILRTIDAFARPDSRVVQVCTLAVFGGDLELPQVTAPVAWRRDIPYVECKLEMAEEVCRRYGARADVIRLGHVWGPGSPAWTGRLASLLRSGEPTGVLGSDGWCNATDVENVASYLAFLLRSTPEPGPSESGARFHHLAELGHLRWSFWIDRLAAELGVAPVRLPASPAPVEKSGRLTARLLAGRRSGSVARSIIRRLPEGARSALRGLRPAVPPLPPTSDRTDPTLLAHLSCPRRFLPQVESSWQPALSVEESWDAVAGWLRGR